MPLHPSLVPLGLGMFQVLQKVVEEPDVCPECGDSGESVVLLRPCEVRSYASWDAVFTSILVGVILYCLTCMRMGGLAWAVVTPPLLLMLFLLGNTVSQDSYVPVPVPLHPALLPAPHYLGPKTKATHDTPDSHVPLPAPAEHGPACQHLVPGPRPAQ